MGTRPGTPDFRRQYDCLFEVRPCIWNLLDWIGVTGPRQLVFLDFVETSFLVNVLVVSGDRAWYIGSRGGQKCGDDGTVTDGEGDLGR